MQYFKQYINSYSKSKKIISQVEMSKRAWDTSKNYTKGRPYQVNEVAHAKM